MTMDLVPHTCDSSDQHALQHLPPPVLSLPGSSLDIRHTSSDAMRTLHMHQGGNMRSHWFQHQLQDTDIQSQ
jgi:hypothetical protein